MAPPLRITSFSANAWRKRNEGRVSEVKTSQTEKDGWKRHGPYSFLLPLLDVLHADGTVPLKQDPAGQAAHLRGQVAPAQRGPQVGAGGAPPLPCTRHIAAHKRWSAVRGPASGSFTDLCRPSCPSSPAPPAGVRSCHR